MSSETSDFPSGLRYTAEHEWVGPGDSADSQRVGITSYAQDQLGDVVYVQLPAVGDNVTASDVCGEIESTKSVSDLYAPISGRVAARNDVLDAEPEKINADPYGAGWMIEIVPDDPASVDSLMSADDYRAQVQSG